MTTGNTQAVVDKTNAPATPSAAESTARTDGDNLDALLAEFDQGTQQAASPSPQPATTAAPQNGASQISREEFDALRMEIAAGRHEKEQSAIKETCANIRGDISPELYDDAMVEGWLTAQSRQNPKIVEAWQRRASNPNAWAGIEKELNTRLKAKLAKMPDANLTADRDAVTAAVKGASSSTKVSTEPAPKLGRMSNAEYRRHVIDNYGFDPGV